MNCLRQISPGKRLPTLVYSVTNGQVFRHYHNLGHNFKLGNRPTTFTCGQNRCSVPRRKQNVIHIPVRHLHPLVWTVFKPLVKITAIFGGRFMRKKLTHNQKVTIFAALSGALGVYAFVFYYSHLETSAITGRTRFIAFSQQQFQEIIQEEVHQMLSENSKVLPSRHVYYKIVTSVAWRLFNSNRDLKEMSEQKWTVAIIEDSSFNAHVFPTGHIIVNTGLMDFVQNVDQLAVIIGHEMSHALLHHAAEQISGAQLLDLIIILAMTAIWAIMPTDGIAIVTQWFMNKVIHIFRTLPYSRDMEREADKVGLMLAAKACFDIREGAVVWARMGLKENIDGLGEIQLPEWLSTHPSNEKRVELINHLLPQMCKLREECKCEPLPAADPRDNVVELKKMVDNHITAVKSGQNLVKVQRLVDPKQRR